MAGPGVVLTMIVRDEAPAIERCLTAIAPLVDAWCIVDTGSTDDTASIITRVMAGVPGELHHTRWRDFAHNRTQALELARPLGDYSIMIDADTECVMDADSDPAAIRSALTADVHPVVIDHGGIIYERMQITSTRLPFRYRGVLHEFLEVPAGAKRGQVIPGVRFVSHFDGARSRNPTKYLDDAKLLRAALASPDDPDLDARYTFYLANSLRDAGAVGEAADAYLQRTAMGGWVEELYVAWLWFARMRYRIDGPTAEVFDALARAHDLVPTRAEACCEAATIARLADRMPTAAVWAARALAIARPESSLFLEPDVYQWRARYEYSIAAWYVGDLAGGQAACERLLSDGMVPEHERSAVIDNLAFYQS
jgi:hypothetical protein